MSSSLPSESAFDQAVQEFGLGPYDSDETAERGEDKNEKVMKKSLPDGGGSMDPIGPDRLLSYPDEHPVLGSTDLPDDRSNPLSRADYFDRTIISEDVWADEDSGAWASSELPGVVKNETTMDDFLSALGNAWSGYEVEDVSSPQGFPSTDKTENSDFPKSNDNSLGGRILSTGVPGMKTDINKILMAFDRGEITLGGLFDLLVGSDTRTFAATGRTAGSLIDLAQSSGRPRSATNHALVGDLAAEFLKEFGKKDLTKRHVLSFLQAKGQPQFLSSDVIRCLKHRHEVYIKDVLDEFPVAKQASSGLASVRDRIVALESEHIRDPQVSSVLRRAAAAVSTAIAYAERLEGRNG